MVGRPVGFALVALAATSASANPMEVLGLTSRHAAQANAGVATADDAAALYYDPAGLVTRPALELSIGTIGAYSHLAIGDRRAPLADRLGAQLTMRAPLPLRGAWTNRIVAGLALHLLPRDVARVIAPAPDQPFYPYFGDRMSRVVVLPGAAIKLTDCIAIGLAINVLAGLTGTIEAREGATRAIDARVDERVPTVARVIAGATWRVRPELRLGAVYRQRFELPFATSARTMVAGEPIDIDLRASGEFTPHQIVVGAGWTPGPLPLVASFDLGWANWSGYPGPFVKVNSALPFVGPVPGQAPAVPFDDTFSARAGLESTATHGFIARAGYAFETSAIPAEQTGVTNLLDGYHHTIGLGAGYTWGHVRLDAHVQLHVISSRHITKAVFGGGGTYDPFTSLRDEDTGTAGVQTTNPGYPGLDSGGEVVSGGLTLELGL